MFVYFQNLHEEWIGGDQNCFVDFNVFTIFTGPGDNRELFVSFQLFKNKCDIFLEIVSIEDKEIVSIEDRAFLRNPSSKKKIEHTDKSLNSKN